ncbi:histidine kinase [Bacillus coahuilensis p1.1.43]|uniref:Histidine kinase n=1 Tax=Bacillus coahuilensis p1.1.43 TaxID=1150625 RepID=A0A147K544_9BACI|nr:2TM domain-containing protein [Bacillus coahuilensis]KUP04693.1 histidine kinase [Bacillus coahuilensis p1.1.43]
MDNNAKYEKAKRRVLQLKGFYYNFTAFLVIIPMLFVINLMGDAGNWWFVYPLTGWGVLVIIHGISLKIGSGWEEKKIKEFMNKDV